MKKEIADKWVAALRSGKYTKGPAALHNLTNDTWCCLGVLCDTLGISATSEVGQENDRRAMYDEASNILPERVRRKAGMNTPNGELVIDGIMDALWRINDVGERTTGGYRSERSPVGFSRIADIIEQNWEQL